MHAEEAEPPDLLRELARQDPLLEPVPDLGQDPLADELPDSVTDRPLLVVEERVEGEEVQRVEPGRLGGRRDVPIVEEARAAVDGDRAAGLS
jgi:hypothetical protein